MPFPGPSDPERLRTGMAAMEQGPHGNGGGFGGVASFPSSALPSPRQSPPAWPRAGPCSGYITAVSGAVSVFSRSPGRGEKCPEAAFNGKTQAWRRWGLRTKGLFQLCPELGKMLPADRAP